ncbi:MAG: prepilin-type N-terminal cleavage/methylation domain-containing protein [Stenotrophomonas sp.]
MSATRRRQRGQSLISMMIGLVISLITIAAMLTLYKTMVGVSNEASVAARRDGQVSAGLLAAQMELQSAGFGVASTVPLGQRLAVSNSGKQVAWRYNDGADHCMGLWVDSKGIYRLPRKDACTDAAAQSWGTSEHAPMALMPASGDGSLIVFSGEKGGASLDGYKFTQKDASCLPYMQQDFSGTPAPAVQRINLENESKDEDDPARVLFSVCLPNLTVASTPPPVGP